MPKKATNVAKTAAELAAPIHFPEVSALNLGKLLARMNASTRDRFMEVWRLTTSFDAASLAIESPMRCPANDAATAVKNGIAVPLPKGTPITCNSFSGK